MIDHVSVGVCDLDRAARFYESTLAPLGLSRLVTRPAASSHVGLSPEERARIGIGEGLVRVSIGLEDPADLIEDFGRALD